MQTSRTFRIFISSTFSDLKAERDALQERVFPVLRSLCESHGCRFQAVDLRWGISEEASVDQQTMKICLAEIARCQKTSPRPNFIILLGDRYGWRPLPCEIPVEEFNLLVENIPPQERDLVNEWYLQEDNAVPAMRVLAPRTGLYKSSEAWGAVEARLHFILRTAARAGSLSSPLLEKYLCSATEQEIQAGALQAEGAAEHVFCFSRRITSLPLGPQSAGYRDLAAGGQPDEESTEMLARLRENLRTTLQGNFKEYQAAWDGSSPGTVHLDALCSDVKSSLEKVILAEIARLQEEDPLQVERSAHADFGSSLAAGFTGRADLLERISKYFQQPGRSALVISGASGSGKSALLAAAIQQAMRQHPQALLLQRFIGVTPGASSGRLLLNSLCLEIESSRDRKSGTVPTDYRSLMLKLPKLLATFTPAAPLILFVDALDQLPSTDPARSLKWIPANLPPNVWMVVSLTPGNLLRTLETRSLPGNRLELPPLPAGEGIALLDRWLASAGRALQPGQKQQVLQGFQECGLPLYLKLAFEEARLWRSTETPEPLPPDIPGMIRRMLHRLGRDSNHGQVLVSRSLGYLGAARNGLSEDEIMDLLSRDEIVRQDFLDRSPRSPQSAQLPVVIWSRLFFDLQPYLGVREADGSRLFTFYHRQLQEVTAEDTLQEQQRQDFACRMAVYYRNQPLTRQGSPNLRKLSQQAYQQAQAGLWDDLGQTLTDFDFLLARLKYYGRECIEDYDLVDTPRALSGISEADRHSLMLIQRTLQVAIQPLLQNVALLPSQILGRLMDDASPLIQRLVSGAKTYSQPPWLRPLAPGLSHPGGPLRGRLVLDEEEVTCLHAIPDGRSVLVASCRSKDDFEYRLGRLNLKDSSWEYILKTKHSDEITCLAAAGERFLSSDGQSLKAWMIQDGRFLFNLEGSSGQILALCMTPDGLRGFSAGEGGELILWDLENGCMLAKTLSGDITGMAIRPGSSDLVAAAGSSLLVHDLQTLELKKELRAFQQGDVSESISITPDGSQAVVVINGNPLVYDLEEQKVTAVYDHHADYALIALALRDGEHALSAGEDHSLHLWRLADAGTVQVFQGHNGTVASLALTPDGILAASGDRKDGTSAADPGLFIWDLKASPPEPRMQPHHAEIASLTLSSDGTRAVSTAEGDQPRLWSIPTGEHLCSLEGQDTTIVNAFFHSDLKRLTALTGTRLIQTWDLETGKVLTRLGTQELPARDQLGPAYWRLFQFMHPARTLAVSLAWKIIQPKEPLERYAFTLWDANSGKPLLDATAAYMAASPAHDALALLTSQGSLQLLDTEKFQFIPIGEVPGLIRSMAFDPSGQVLAVASEPDGIQIWDLRKQQKITQVGARAPWDLLAFWGSNRLLAFGAHLMAWDIPSGIPLFHLEGLFHTQFILDSLCVPPLDDRLVGILNRGELSRLLIFDLQKGIQLLNKEILPAWGHSLDSDLLGQGRFGVSFGSEGRLHVWDANRGRIACSYQADCTLTAWDADARGETIVCGDQQGGLHILRFEGGVDDTHPQAAAPVADGAFPARQPDPPGSAAGTVSPDPLFFRLHGHDRPITALEFSPDGCHLFSACADGTLSRWDTGTMRQETLFSGHLGWISTCALAGNGGLLLSGGVDKTLRIWEAHSGRLLHTLEGHSDSVMACAFSPDGSLALSASRDKTLRLWSVQSGSLLHVLKGHTERVGGCAFSPGGDRIYSTGYDRTLRIWDPSSGQLLQTVEIPHGGEAICRSSPDGQTLVTEADFNLLLWETSTLQQKVAWKGHTDTIHACAFSQDGSRLVSAGEDRRLCIWSSGGNGNLPGPGQLFSLKTPGENRSVALHPSKPWLAVGDETGTIVVQAHPSLDGKPGV